MTSHEGHSVSNHRRAILSVFGDTGIILCMCQANERRRCNVTSPLVGWAHSQNDRWYYGAKYVAQNFIYMSITRASVFRVMTYLLPGSKPSPGVGVTKIISSVPLFCVIFSIVKTHVSYWISRLYLTGVAAAQLWWHLSDMMWFKESNRYFCKIENFAYGEINERSFSNPHPWTDD